MIWNEYIECMSRDERANLQSERLRKMVERLYSNVPFYRKKFQEAGISPTDIKGIEDLPKLPFTYKQDLRDNYPFGLFAVPQSEIVRIHASSGTTGKQTVVGYTRKDLDMWSECVARALTSVGVSKKDIVQVGYGYGLFTGGLGPHYACEPYGCTAIPVSTGQTDRQIQILTEWKPNVICCTPTYMLGILDRMDEKGISKDELNLRCGIFGAEPWTKEMKQEIEERSGMRAFDIYGLSEILGPGVGCSCDKCDMIHINSDHFWPEIVDPQTGEPLPEGELGELVFTSFTKEAVPLIRYNTHDLTRIHYGKCECGRTTPRMEKITGRADGATCAEFADYVMSKLDK
mgnify:CR=1 FL=1